MRVLFIGGTGVISTACSKLCAERGMDLWLLNRGNYPERMPALHHSFILADVNDVDAVKKMLNRSEWDCVVDWTMMTPQQARRDIELFAGRTKQLIYISSTSLYRPLNRRISEGDPVGNSIWQYARDKLEAERVMMVQYREEGFPVTIVRPGHTYCEFTIPTNILGLGYGLVRRIRQGKKIIVHDDGLSLWTMTHSSDFAVGLAGLIGKEEAIGETFHITSDEALTWLDIFRLYGQASRAEPELEFIPSTAICQIDPEIGASLLGDRALNRTFDNSKIKRFATDYRPQVSVVDGIRRSLKWHRENQSKVYDSRQDEAVQLILRRYKDGLQE